MSFGRSRPLGLRTRITVWTTVVLATAFAVALLWVHHGLRRVLEARNDAFLQSKATELLASVEGHHPGDKSALHAEIGREVAAYDDIGLAIAVREPGRVTATPDDDLARRLADGTTRPGTPATVQPDATGPRFRVLATRPDDQGFSLVLAITLSETEATLAEFDRWVGGGAVAFLVPAVVGGLLLSRQALRPVAQSIAAARKLDPGDLSERLPLTGAGDELDELAATINGLLDRLAAYHAQIIRFTADASHELRSPLAAMRAAVEVALHQPRTASEYRDTLATLGEQCEQLTGHVNGLLLLARADAGEVAIRRDAVDLSALAGEAAEMYEPLAEERGITLRWACDPGVIVAGDAQRLRQLVTNLVDNAIKFTPAGGSVHLSVEATGPDATLSIVDTGIGIGAEHLPHIFERFYQADTARSSAGSGLGLSLCRWIVAAHAGSIQAESTEGAGTRFTVRLLRADPPPG